MPSQDKLEAYRPNVGIALFAPSGRVLVGRRVGDRGAHRWQMPQGGIDAGEAAEAAAVRELEEETGVRPELIEPLGAVDRWLTYDFPPEVRARKRRKGQDWAGQKQRWFAFRFTGADADIKLDAHHPAEFDDWRWESLASTPSLVIPWKRPVYAVVAQEFAVHERKLSSV
ncbi:MAG: RNA pyrophosphohydrolase [Maricaulaceae bacterium]